jgi:hypothetical protein
MYVLPVGAELFIAEGKTDRQTDQKRPNCQLLFVILPKRLKIEFLSLMK